MDLKIDVKPRNGNIILAELSGKIGLQTVNVINDNLDRIINEGIVKILIDFKNVTYVDSNGLGALINLARKARKLNGNIKICGISSFLQQIFNTLRLIKDDINEAGFEIFNSEEEGLKSF